MSHYTKTKAMEFLVLRLIRKSQKWKEKNDNLRHKIVQKLKYRNKI